MAWVRVWPRTSAIRGLLSSSGALKEPEDLFLRNAHKIINLKPKEDRRLAKNCSAEVSTHYLVNLIVEEVLKAQRSELRMFYRRLMEVPAMRQAAGRVFERLVHEYFERGGTSFNVGRPLQNSDTLAAGRTFALTGSEEFPNLQLLKPTLHTTGSQQVPGGRREIYFRPLAWNMAAIDSLTFSHSLNMPLLF